MDLDKAIVLLKQAVKNNGTNDSKHIDLSLVPIQMKPEYEKALIVAKISIMEGKISQDDFMARIDLNS